VIAKVYYVDLSPLLDIIAKVVKIKKGSSSLNEKKL